MTEFDRLARQVYVGARDGVLDPEAAFDLACFLVEGGPPPRSTRCSNCAATGCPPFARSLRA
jgi:hypothetical protein